MTSKISTPIVDFVKAYTGNDPLRLHMPGHKGKPFLGCEPYDITEIDGADSLFEAKGVIAESEKIAGDFFGANTFFSTEGSSLCIRAMLFLAAQQARKETRPRVLAWRNVHKSFLTAAALLDLDVEWIYPEQETGFLSAEYSLDALEKKLDNSGPSYCAVYLTAPDYLGCMPDIRGIAEICHKHRVMLLVDNAHGAYLKMLKPSRHPIDLGADMCCDSAHKTLPALTGAAYLHISRNDPFRLTEKAKNAMAMFGSTSPSYLILQSLDLVNLVLEDYQKSLPDCIAALDTIRKKLMKAGYVLIGEEPLKITVLAKEYGYSGTELKKILEEKGIYPEFADPDYLVCMFSPVQTENELDRFADCMLAIEKRKAVNADHSNYRIPMIRCSVREAMLSDSEWMPTELCEGRVLASPCVSCPPAVPILMCGEIVDRHAMERFHYYGIEQLLVMKA